MPPPLPPNRTCGSPAYGSPVGSFSTEIGSRGRVCERVNSPAWRKEAFEPPSSDAITGAANTGALVLDASPYPSNAVSGSGPCLANMGTRRPLFASGARLRPSTFLPSFPQHGFATRACGGSRRRGTTRTLTPAQLTRRAGLPASLASPSGRSALNHVVRPCIALSVTSACTVISQASPWNPQARRNTQPNQVRSPADRPFASGCSPPRLAATQLPSA